MEYHLGKKLNGTVQQDAVMSEGQSTAISLYTDKCLVMLFTRTPFSSVLFDYIKVSNKDDGHVSNLMIAVSIRFHPRFLV